MPKPEKLTAVAEMKELFENSDSFFITDYHGLNVADMTVLRKQLRNNEVTYLVAKNTLLRIAAKEANKQGLDKYFTGPTAVAFAMKDPSVAAKILNTSFKEKERPRVKVFVVADEVHGPEAMQRLADLPSREVLLSMLVGAVESPLTSLVGSIDAFFQELIGSVDALAEKRKGEVQ